MRTTQWMVTLVMAGALCAGTAMAADAAEADKQPAARLGQGSAAVAGESDACPVHNMKNSGQKGVLGKEGEQCSCPHGMMHMHHMKHMSKQETCDPAKAAGKPAKPAS